MKWSNNINQLKPADFGNRDLHVSKGDVIALWMLSEVVARRSSGRTESSIS